VLASDASWINQIERFFAELTEKRHRSARNLKQAIWDCVKAVNDHPKTKIV
jgi:hypothetical protein